MLGWQGKKWIKVVAITVVIAFLTYDIAWATDFSPITISTPTSSIPGTSPSLFSKIGSFISKSIFKKTQEEETPEETEISFRSQLIPMKKYGERSGFQRLESVKNMIKRQQDEVRKRQRIEEDRVTRNIVDYTINKGLYMDGVEKALEAQSITEQVMKARSSVQAALGGDNYVLNKDGSKITYKNGLPFSIENERVIDAFGQVSIRNTWDMQYNHNRQLLSYNTEITDALGNVSGIYHYGREYSGNFLIGYKEITTDPYGTVIMREWSTTGDDYDSAGRVSAYHEVIKDALGNAISISDQSDVKYEGNNIKSYHQVTKDAHGNVNTLDWEATYNQQNLLAEVFSKETRINRDGPISYSENTTAYTYDNSNKLETMAGNGIFTGEDEFGNRNSGITTQEYEIIDGQLKLIKNISIADYDNIDGSSTRSESTVRYSYTDTNLLAGAEGVTYTTGTDTFGNGYLTVTTDTYDVIASQTRRIHSVSINDTQDIFGSIVHSETVNGYRYDEETGELLSAQGYTDTRSQDLFGVESVTHTENIYQIINGQPKIVSSETRGDLINPASQLGQTIAGIQEFLEGYVSAITPQEKQAKLGEVGLQGLELDLVELTREGFNKITSWLWRASTRVINCAITSIYNILSGIGVSVSKEELLEKAILIDVLTGLISPETAIGDLRLSMYSMVNAALAKGVTLHAANVTIDQLKSIAQPVIAHVGGNHYIVVKSIDNSTVTYVEDGVEDTLTTAEFLSIWEGNILTPTLPEGAEALDVLDMKAIKGAEYTYGPTDDGYYVWIEGDERRIYFEGFYFERRGNPGEDGYYIYLHTQGEDGGEAITEINGTDIKIHTRGSDGGETVIHAENFDGPGVEWADYWARSTEKNTITVARVERSGDSYHIDGECFMYGGLLTMLISLDRIIGGDITSRELYVLRNDAVLQWPNDSALLDNIANGNTVYADWSYDELGLGFPAELTFTLTDTDTDEWSNGDTFSFTIDLDGDWEYPEGEGGLFVINLTQEGTTDYNIGSIPVDWIEGYESDLEGDNSDTDSQNVSLTARVTITYPNGYPGDAEVHVVITRMSPTQQSNTYLDVRRDEGEYVDEGEDVDEGAWVDEGYYGAPWTYVDANGNVVDPSDFENEEAIRALGHEEYIMGIPNDGSDEIQVTAYGEWVENLVWHEDLVWHENLVWHADWQDYYRTDYSAEWNEYTVAEFDFIIDNTPSISTSLDGTTLYEKIVSDNPNANYDDFTVYTSPTFTQTVGLVSGSAGWVPEISRNYGVSTQVFSDLSLHSISEDLVDLIDTYDGNLEFMPGQLTNDTAISTSGIVTCTVDITIGGDIDGSCPVESPENIWAVASSQGVFTAPTSSSILTAPTILTFDSNDNVDTIVMPDESGDVIKYVRKDIVSPDVFRMGSLAPNKSDIMLDFSEEGRLTIETVDSEKPALMVHLEGDKAILHLRGEEIEGRHEVSEDVYGNKIVSVDFLHREIEEEKEITLKTSTGVVRAIKDFLEEKMRETGIVPEKIKRILNDFAGIDKFIKWLTQMGTYVINCASKATRLILAKKGINVGIEEIAVDMILLDLIDGTLSSKTTSILYNTFSTIEKIVKNNGLGLKTMYLTRSQLENITTPVIAHVGGDHAVIVTGVYEDKVSVIESDGKFYDIPINSFLEEWNGYVLAERPPPIREALALEVDIPEISSPLPEFIIPEVEDKFVVPYLSTPEEKLTPLAIEERLERALEFEEESVETEILLSGTEPFTTDVLGNRVFQNSFESEERSLDIITTIGFDGSLTYTETWVDYEYDVDGRLIGARGGGITWGEDVFGSSYVTTSTDTYIILAGQAKRIKSETVTQSETLYGSTSATTGVMHYEYIDGTEELDLLMPEYLDEEGNVLIGLLKHVEGNSATEGRDILGSSSETYTENTYEVYKGQPFLIRTESTTIGSDFFGASYTIKGTTEYTYGEYTDPDTGETSSHVLVDAEGYSSTTGQDIFGNFYTSDTSDTYTIIAGQAFLTKRESLTSGANLFGSEYETARWMEYKYGKYIDPDTGRSSIYTLIEVTGGEDSTGKDIFGNSYTATSTDTYGVLKGQNFLKSRTSTTTGTDLFGNEYDTSSTVVNEYDWVEVDGEKAWNIDSSTNTSTTTGTDLFGSFYTTDSVAVTEYGEVARIDGKLAWNILKSTNTGTTVTTDLFGNESTTTFTTVTEYGEIDRIDGKLAWNIIKSTNTGATIGEGLFVGGAYTTTFTTVTEYGEVARVDGKLAWNILKSTNTGTTTSTDLFGNESITDFTTTTTYGNVDPERTDNKLAWNITGSINTSTTTAIDLFGNESTTTSTTITEYGEVDRIDNKIAWNILRSLSTGTTGTGELAGESAATVTTVTEYGEVARVDGKIAWNITGSTNIGTTTGTDLFGSEYTTTFTTITTYNNVDPERTDNKIAWNILSSINEATTQGSDLFGSEYTTTSTATTTYGEV
ncbi:MAG: hypothetical protein KJ957_05180, partial [Candidatus Omnitrophica bacterium]|nr:hypothetical protein [Candidatus Omnitrophota bacterium]